MKMGCNFMLNVFCDMCVSINFPVSVEKTCTAEPIMVFLGTLLNGILHIIAIREEKRIKALNIIQWICAKKKATVKQLQRLAGILNFLNRAIYPGHAFTRRIYAKFANPLLKHYHHVCLTQEFRKDCAVWEVFLSDMSTSLFRPFIDLNGLVSAMDISFTSDASAAKTLGFGCVYGREWSFGQWPPNFIEECELSIEFLELYALVVGISIWIEKFQSKRVLVFCDNISAVYMVNNSTSSCPRCMVLIRLLVLKSLVHNTRVFAKHIMGRKNVLSDSLSRLRLDLFRKNAPLNMKTHPEKLPTELWLVEKVWNLYKN